MNSINSFFSGDKLYGDDFSYEEIKQWHEDEKEGYANLGSKDRENYNYSYHQLNTQEGFQFIKNRNFNNVLGVGSAYGDEFKPIINNLNNITILDPSDAFSNTKEVLNTPVNYVKPNIDGRLDFQNNSFDLITSLGVMHHIPNITYVLNECFRCLKPNGIMLLREPIISMGDWRKPRLSLTKNERGIPIKILDNILLNAGFKLIKRNLCMFPLIPKISNKFGYPAYNSLILTKLDKLFCTLFFWNKKYHRKTVLDKLGPSNVYYVLTK